MSSLVSLVANAIEGSAVVPALRKCGWIGIDVGSACVKLAQLERTSDGFRFQNRWIIGERATVAATAVESLEEKFGELRQARTLFRGRQSAAALSSCFAPLRSLQLPEASAEETRSMIYEEFAAENDFVEPSEVDAWPIEGGMPPPGQVRWMATAVSRIEVERLARQFLCAGYHLHTLDVAAPALARALALSDPETVAPLAALDVGRTSAVFTIARQGVAGFCRVLRGCGYENLMQPLIDSAGLNPDECRQLLQARRSAGAAGDSDVLAPLSSLFAVSAERLAEELRRTLQFIRQEYPSVMPERIRLFGGGGMMSDVAPLLERASGLPTHPWRLSGDGPDGDQDPLFGVAAGLSALAWSRSCT
jgi:Tfp pilus assembly PilM family ATPase